MKNSITKNSNYEELKLWITNIVSEFLPFFFFPLLLFLLCLKQEETQSNFLIKNDNVRKFNNACHASVVVDIAAQPTLELKYPAW